VSFSLAGSGTERGASVLSCRDHGRLDPGTLIDACPETIDEGLPVP